MSERANEKIKIVLENILEKYALAGTHPVLGIGFHSDEIALGIKDYEETSTDVNTRERELDRLLLLLNGLVNRNILEKVDHTLREHHDEFLITDKYIIDFPEDFRVKALGYLKELSGESAVFDKRKLGNKLTLENRKNGLYLIGDRKAKEIRISDDANSRQAKLFKHLFLPEIGLYKTVESTVEAMRSDRDITPVDSEKLIATRFKEIQSIFSQAKAQTKFSLHFNDNNVAMIIK